MKSLLSISAVLEVLTGIALIASPSLAANLLLGANIESTLAITIARIAGAALISLAIICWLSRKSSMANNVVKAMLFYNVATVSILLSGKFGSDLSGLGLWPAIILHTSLAAWCIQSLQKK
jgi:hypothetical protein